MSCAVKDAALRRTKHGSASRSARERSGLLLLVALLAVPGAHSQLAFIQQNSAVNPLQGQATAPEGFNEDDVSVYVILNRLLDVNDNSYSFKVNFWWGMMWQDERAYEQIQSNTLSDPTYVCQAWCSTEQGLDALLTERGYNASSSTSSQALCCDNVYVPGAVAQNVIGYDVQSLPVQYQLVTLPNNTVSYRVQVQGDFYTNFNFKSYPFDRHQMTINIQTQFVPRSLKDGAGNGADFLVLYAQNYGGFLDDTGMRPPNSVDVYNSAQLSQGQAWQIDKLELDVMNFTYGISGSRQDPTFSQAQEYDLNTQGVRFVIHISRTSKGFYALMIIVPISLIILFSFVIFILPVTQIKGRMNIMATLFLTLIVLQFVLEGIMPTSYTLIPPYYLLLVSYIYIFGMVGLAIFTNSLATQWQRRSARIGRTEARQKFWNWIQDLPPPPPGSKLAFGQLPTHHHNPITESRQALSRILTRRFASAKEEKQGGADMVATNKFIANGHSQDNNGPAMGKTKGFNDYTTTKPDQADNEDRFDEDDEFESVNGDHREGGQHHTMVHSKSRPWTMKERSSIITFLLRNDKIRWWSMWWYFIGLPESKEYCEFCAIKVERWALPIIFLSYAAVVAIIFGVAQSSSSSNLDSPVG